jgi:hypothetical protein
MPRLMESYMNHSGSNGLSKSDTRRRLMRKNLNFFHFLKLYFVYYYTISTLIMMCDVYRYYGCADC